MDKDIDNFLKSNQIDLVSLPNFKRNDFMSTTVDGHQFRMDGGLLEIKLEGVWGVVKSVTQSQAIKLRKEGLVVAAWEIK